MRAISLAILAFLLAGGCYEQRDAERCQAFEEAACAWALASDGDGYCADIYASWITRYDCERSGNPVEMMGMECKSCGPGFEACLAAIDAAMPRPYCSDADLSACLEACEF